ncbi:ATP-binding protein [Streptomyces griseofuscus]|uniref:ATP-binding protein n=1 Tax=Streptomyces griseofuscus TaxID=146922 RepID=A0A3R8Q6R6_9ACTN|nr:ATP-binding protein [Streptomyces griseofuscus]RRQ79244.1 ATP-binding protein [Streptomyces griseofuscus]
MAGQINDTEGDRCDGPDDEASFALSGAGSCIAEARHRTAAFLTRTEGRHPSRVPGRVVSLAELVVSELVTNACKYAPGPIQLRLSVAGDALEVEVWDSDPVLPTASDADPERVGRHGLEVVKAVAHLTVLRETVGKRVTARILLSPA